MGTAISCKECSQMAGLIQKVGRDSSKAPSLRAAVFRLKIVRAAIVTVNHHVLSVCKRTHEC